MKETTPPAALAGRRQQVGFVSTYPPTRCGIGRFAESLATNLSSIAPDVQIDLARLVDGSDRAPYSGAGIEFDPNTSIGIRAAARRLNESDVVMIQHEYGIYGADDGQAVVDLASLIDRPMVTVLHTVLPEPSPRQEDIVHELHGRSQLVVMCQAASSILSTRYDIPEQDVVVIPHGVHWAPQPTAEPPVRRLVSWGLLGPGKGIERALQALAQLDDVTPALQYQIVGRTHPMVARQQGFEYRRSLEQLVHELGLDDTVEFTDRYVGDDELLHILSRAHLVLVPYDNADQVSSGVITDALGAGRPVVATRFPFAREMLDPGPGLAVPHDVDSIAEAIRHFVESPQRYADAAAAAAATGVGLAWSAVASRFADLIRRAAEQKATA